MVSGQKYSILRPKYQKVHFCLIFGAFKVKMCQKLRFQVKMVQFWVKISKKSIILTIFGVYKVKIRFQVKIVQFLDQNIKNSQFFYQHLPFSISKMMLLMSKCFHVVK